MVKDLMKLTGWKDVTEQRQEEEIERMRIKRRRGAKPN